MATRKKPKKLTKKMLVEARDALREKPAEFLTVWDFPTNDGVFRIRAYPSHGQVRIWRAEFGDGVSGEWLTIRSKEEFDHLAQTLNVAYTMAFGAIENYKEP